ncbi:MAG: hypothetical protein HRT67_05975 [Flavobacteriaceae bacterium]|nr:hypothetical protein [Flavobacteriaceae bacterium]
MNNNNILYVFLVITCVACKTVSVEQDLYHKALSSVVLGAIGEQKDFVLKHSYKNIALPNYKNRLKIQITVIPFTKSTFRAYNQAKVTRKNDFSVEYSDSLKIKPKFLKIELSDRVEVLNALNSSFNHDIKQYIQHKKQSQIVLGVLMVLKPEDLNTIENAHEVFLEREGLNSYALKLYKNSELEQTILFDEGVVFGYQRSSFCWQEDSMRQLSIVDLVDGDAKCPRYTYRNFRRAHKKINYFKL